MMKIGILTHHYVNNYGAFLQAWALREAVARLIPEAEVEIIDYINLKHFVINTGGWFRFYKDRENLSCWLQKIRVPSTFSRARKKEMKLSKRCYTVQQINSLNYDYVIVGSDEVWNFKDSKANLPVKFGVGLICKNLIAYAPSVGQTTPNEKIPVYVENGIKNFKDISSRDDLTYKLVEKVTGKVPTRVLDPTFLSAFPSANINIKAPYVLFYYCEKLPQNIKKQVFKYAKDRGLKIYGAGECDKGYSDITVNLPPFEWIEMFRNAEHVFTGTFHGVVFSILNRKQFHVYLTNESRIKKVGALLKELDIEDRNINQDFELKLDMERINYDAVYKVIDKKRYESEAFILNAIKGKR